MQLPRKMGVFFGPSPEPSVMVKAGRGSGVKEGQTISRHLLLDLE
jgi:hypothetical protein